jgi:membrane-bound lytic murein transglycosylase D
LRSTRVQRGGIIVLVALGAFACAHGRPQSPETLPTSPEARPAEDRTASVIAEADSHLEAGAALIRDGHLNHAREEFDRAVDVYLTTPGGAYANPRLGEAYRRTLETIHAREVEALAAGDGFTETQPEPASIDEVGDIAVSEAPPTEETRRTAEEAVEGEANDLPIALNDAVLSCIDLYQGRLRDWFTAALARGGRYLPGIRETFAAEGIPQDLAYVALVESAFKPAALSRARAKGVWQFISDTGRRYGLTQDWWVDERSDPEKATRAAARYLKELYGMFGDWSLALAAYNAGEATVSRGIARYGTNDFWALCRTRAFRRETRNYVPLIHAAIVVAKAPERYGFEVTPEEATEADTVPVHGAVDLRVIAECAGTSLDQVRILNPQLRRMATPAGRTFDVKVPVGTGESLGRCLSALPPEKRVQFRTHVVARGQTLSTIARSYGARTQDIASANGISSLKRLAVGTELIIPIEASVRSASHLRPTRAAGPASGPVRISYRIRRGDTLGSIASQYGTTIQDLQSWNGLKGTRIAAGETLTIYTTRKF